MNWFINRQDSGSTASILMLMVESLALNLLFRAVRPRGTQAQGKRMDSPEPRLALTTGIS